MKVIVLRGISGSGKSTWTAKNAPTATVVSADNFFRDAQGNYVFDDTKKHEAHMQCFRDFMTAIMRRDPLIVVDNTNITPAEYAPYVMPAQAFGYDVEILTLKCDPEIAIQRKDWVPPEKVRRTAKSLDQETVKLPGFMKNLHRVINNN